MPNNSNNPSNISAWNLVTTGITANPNTEMCRCLVSKLVSFRSYDRNVDSNGITYANVRGKKWYRKCTGAQENWWDKELRSNKTTKTAAGLLASDEWKHLRENLDSAEHGPFLIVALQNCSVARATGVPFQVKNKLGYFGNSYCVLRSEQELVNLYKLLPPADRFLQEVILPNAPHKCFMDIERDIESNGRSEADLNREMDFMKRGLIEKFVPLVCDFFTQKLKIKVTPRDCYLTDSSKSRVKFSTHLVITTPHVHYFRNRVDSWVAMTVLAKYLEQKAACDVDFHKWYFQRDVKNRLITTWDFGVYGKGARNMRMIGACKGLGLILNTKWKNCRVFVPVDNQKYAAYHNFIATAYMYQEKTPIVISTDIKGQAYFYCEEVRKKIDKPHWFQNSVGISRYMININIRYISNAEQEQLEISTNRQRDNNNTGANGGRRGGLGRIIGGGEREGIQNTLESLSMTILNMGSLEDVGDGGVDDEDTMDAQMRMQRREMKDRFLGSLQKVLEDIGALLHQGNSIDNVVFEATEFGIASLRMNAWKNGDRNNGRECYFGCTNGSHQVNITIRVDFCVQYFCFACRRRTIIMQTPIRARCVQPRDISKVVPDDFVAGVIDYDKIPHDPTTGEDRIHMRTIRPLDNGTYLSGPSTVVLHGRMGTGKTVATNAFLRTLREDWREQNKPGQPSIAAFTFRKMLAQMFANSFELLNYTESQERSLFDESCIAIQLESIERLGKPEVGAEDVGLNGTGGQATGLSLDYKGVWDVIILDEVESLLAHFSSSTMKDRLSVIWKIFYHLTKRCRALIVCDADIGPRTFEFLRMVRSREGVDGNGRYIPGLQYHINRHIAIKTRFIDYASEVDWKDALIRSLVEGKNIFYFSNNKTHMRNLERYIRDTLTRWKTKRIAQIAAYTGHADIEAALGDAYIARFDDVLENISVIDADISETEKKKLSNCNVEWSRMRLVMISPTVGAGIDFTVDHFHKTFGYVTYTSCCARAINQMRGRVRRTKDSECHLYICDNERDSVNTKKKTKKRRRNENENDDDENENENENYDDEEEGSDIEPNEKIDIPLTLDAANASLIMNRETYFHDMVAVSEMRDDGQEHLIVRQTTIPTQLQRVLAYNIVEENKSKKCIRNEFISLLLAGDPDVDYTFLTNIDHKKENKFKVALLYKQIEQVDASRARISCQDEMNKEDYIDLRREDNQGSVELLSKHPNLAATIKKNEIKHFYGIKNDLSSAEWEDIHRICGETNHMEQVRNVAYILGASCHNLYRSAVSSGVLQKLDIGLMIGDGEIEKMTVKQRTAQEIWPCDHVVRVWTTYLMYACGFEFPDGIQGVNNGINPISIMPGNKGVFAHKGLCENRLREKDLQKWLWKRHQYIKKKSNIGNSCRNTPEEGEDWDWGTICGFFKNFSISWFGIDFEKSKKKKKTVDGASQIGSSSSSCSTVMTPITVRSNRSKKGFGCRVIHIAEDGSTPENACKLMRVKYDGLQSMLAKTISHLNAPYTGNGEEPSIRATAREQILKMMNDNNIPSILEKYTNQPENMELEPPQPEPQQQPGEEEQKDADEDGEHLSQYGGYANNGFQAQDAYQNSYDPIEVRLHDDIPDEAADERPLSSFKSMAENDLLNKLMTSSKVAKDHNPVVNELKELRRQGIIMNYVGPSPYGLSATEFVALLSSSAYQARIKRKVDLFLSLTRATS